ncbi:hypothetical protein AXK60_24900 [Tsukamurella pseudospumae]|uniref:Uncharacterized protein n=2 Tax=Tsukamurella pseudospumae TaxID=239498 RepID=A0A138AK81_9ACTN|nr:hypothetical protein AXK60_24900 [Tsukamurella pseudospumae]
MIEWFRAGKAATKAQYGSPSPYVIERALTDHELRTDIALETYVSSLRPFFEHVDNGGFDPSAGASLTTYFIGHCRNNLTAVINRHDDRRTGTPTDPYELTNELSEHLRNDTGPGAAEDTETQEISAELAAIFRAAPAPLQAVLLRMTYRGDTLTEAASDTGYNRRTISSYLHRLRGRVLIEFSAGQLDLPEGTFLHKWAVEHLLHGDEGAA